MVQLLCCEEAGKTRREAWSSAHGRRNRWAPIANGCEPAPDCVRAHHMKLEDGNCPRLSPPCRKSRTLFIFWQIVARQEAPDSAHGPEDYHPQAGASLAQFLATFLEAYVLEINPQAIFRTGPRITPHVFRTFAIGANRHAPTPGQGALIGGSHPKEGNRQRNRAGRRKNLAVGRFPLNSKECDQDRHYGVPRSRAKSNKKCNFISEAVRASPSHHPNSYEVGYGW
jgi:hypothetical protein